MKKQGAREQVSEGARVVCPPRLRYFAGPAIVLLAAFVAIVPQLIRGNSCGHDFDVHLVSWLDCVNAWHHGIPYPHWAPSPNYGAGEPRFVFYPPLTWMLGAALGLIFGWHFAPIALTFLTLAATGLATRALALRLAAWGCRRGLRFSSAAAGPFRPLELRHRDRQRRDYAQAKPG